MSNETEIKTDGKITYMVLASKHWSLYLEYQHNYYTVQFSSGNLSRLKKYENLQVAVHTFLDLGKFLFDSPVHLPELFND